MPLEEEATSLYNSKLPFLILVIPGKKILSQIPGILENIALKIINIPYLFL